MNYFVSGLNSFEDTIDEEGVRDWKIIFFKYLLLITLVIYISRLFYFQVYKYSYYIDKSVSNYTNRQSVLPNRGIIYDSEGRSLVSNLAKHVVTINLQGLNRYKQYDSIEQILSSEEIKVLKKYKIVFQDPDTLTRFNEGLNLGRNYIVLKELNDDTQYYSFLSDLSILNSPTVSLSEEVYRDYTAPDYFSHILGYTSSVSKNDLVADSWYTANSKIGVAGLEKSYETYLRGEKGLLKEFAFSDAKVEDTNYITKEKNGYSVYTSINSKLQEVSYLSLKKAIEKFEAKGGAVVVQNPNTGEILSLVSYPGYDNNLFSGGISSKQYESYLKDPQEPLINKAISSNYPPGSTFKLVLAYAGLLEKSLTVSDFITDVGVIRVGDFNYKTWKEGGHGVINIVGAIKESSDTFFYILGGGHSNYPQIKPLGPWNIYKYAKIFGLGELTGIDLPNEVSGFIPSPSWKEAQLNEPWYIGNTYHMSIGQGFMSSTPLQTNVLTSTIANGGNVYRPYLVKKVVDESVGTVILSHSPEKINSTSIDPNILNVLKEGMVQASSPGGTAYPLFNFPIKVAGKTGTSEFGSSDNNKTHAWYTVFAPVDNPEIAITVFVEEGGGGSDVAVPVAKDILESYFKIVKP